jgi:hypothetical protein
MTFTKPFGDSVIRKMRIPGGRGSVRVWKTGLDGASPSRSLNELGLSWYRTACLAAKVSRDGASPPRSRCDEDNMFPRADAVCIVLGIASIKSPVSED